MALGGKNAGCTRVYSAAHQRRCAAGLGPLAMRVMSMDLFLPDDATPVTWKAPTQQEAFVWRGTMEMTTLRELLTDTVWGELDCLFLDLPPGAERLPNVAGLLPFMAGALIVTIPSQVSQLIVQNRSRWPRECCQGASLA